MPTPTISGEWISKWADWETHVGNPICNFPQPVRLIVLFGSLRKTNIIISLAAHRQQNWKPRGLFRIPTPPNDHDPFPYYTHPGFPRMSPLTEDDDQPTSSSYVTIIYFINSKDNFRQLCRYIPAHPPSRCLRLCFISCSSSSPKLAGSS